MSLVKEGDLIIPNTVGIISASVKEANRHLDKVREHAEQENINNSNMAEYIREVPQIHSILQQRVNGIPLVKLVNPARISDNANRSLTKADVIRQQEMGGNTNNQRAYEDWFRS